MIFWTQDLIDACKRILSQHTVGEFPQALTAISHTPEFRGVTASSLRHAFLRFGEELPSTFLRAEKAAKNTSKFENLLKHTKKGPVSFTQLCDKLDMSPSKVKALVEEAKKQGSRFTLNTTTWASS